jgi:BMFP domain-containing protein YqiC
MRLALDSALGDFFHATRLGPNRPGHVGKSKSVADGVKPMAETKFFEELDRKMKEVLAQSPAKDLERNLRALLTSAFSRLDLVTREEFDVQREVLARTRAKLEALEARVAELEKQVTPDQ